MDKVLQVLGYLTQLHADIFNDLSLFLSRCREMGYVSEDVGYQDIGYSSPRLYTWEDEGEEEEEEED